MGEVGLSRALGLPDITGPLLERIGWRVGAVSGSSLTVSFSAWLGLTAGPWLWEVGVQSIASYRGLGRPRVSRRWRPVKLPPRGVWDLVVVSNLRRVRFHGLPAPSIVQLHPVVLAILNFAGGFERLGEEVTHVVIVGSVLESEVADVCEVLVELLCRVALVDVTGGI